MSFAIKNKYSFYYLLAVITLYIFLKFLPNDFILGIFDFFITALPFTIIIAASILAYVRTRHNTGNSPEEAERIRKKFFTTILQMMVITLLFYILYSPQSFRPYLEAFQRMAKLLSFENYFLLLIYIAIFALAGTLIQIFVKVYLHSQGFYQQNVQKTIKNSLYTLFFIFLLIFGSSLAVYPTAYTPITQYVESAFSITNANQPSQSGVSTLATAFSKSLKNLKNNVAYSNQNVAKSIQETSTILSSNISHATADVKANLLNDIEDKLDLNGGTVDGKLTINKTLTVGGTTNSKDIVPQDDGSYDIGSASKGWGNAYISRLHGSSPIIVGDLSSAHSLSSSDDFIISGDFEVRNDSYFDGETYFTRNIDLGSNRITSLADPQAATDAANKQYVDNQLGAAAFVQRVGTTLSAVNAGDAWDLTSGLVTINNLSLNGTLTANNIGTHNLGLVSFTNGAVTGVTTLNNLTLASTSNGFTIAGGTSSKTLTMNGNLTVSGSSTVNGSFSGTSSGTNTGDQTSVTGNAGTVTNGLYSDGSYSNPDWLTSLSASKISAGSGAVTIAAGGTNQNITLTPSGTGNTILNGNVGIGTDTPVGNLNVIGAASVSDVGSCIAFNPLAGIRVYDPGLGGTWQSASDISGYTPNADGTWNSWGDMYINYYSTGDTYLSSGGGNVFIGAVTGASKLNVRESGAKLGPSTGITFSNAATGATGSAKIGLSVSSTGSWTGTNTGLAVNATGGTTAYAATFSGGNVGIGTTTPQATLDVRGSILSLNGGITGTEIVNSITEGVASVFQQDVALWAGMAFLGAGEDISGFDQNFIKTRSTDGTTPAIVSSGDEMGVFNFYGDSGGGGVLPGAKIAASVDGTPVSGISMPGRLSFYTSKENTGVTSPTERMRINSSGNVGIGTAATTPLGRLHVRNSGVVTATAYNGYFNNIATNATVDGINKYGMYITSTGTFTGPAEGAANNNYALYVDTPSGADNNYAAIFAGGNVGIGTTTPSALLSVGATSQFQVNSSGQIAAVAGYTQASGNFAMSGTGTFGTGTGAVSLNGDTTIAAGKNLTINGAGGTGVVLNTFTGTTTTASTITANSLSSGTGLSISSNSTSGTDSSTSTMLNIARSGANANSSHTAYGLYSSVTDTGTTSTNTAGYFTASGASTNYGLYVNAGSIWTPLGDGTVTVASNVLTTSSDERLKNVDGSFKVGLDAIMGLKPINYHWNTLSGLGQADQYTGFSAQNVQKFIPEAVATDSKGFLSLSDRPILAATVNAIKEQQTQISNDNAELADQKNHIISLETLAVKLQAQIDELKNQTNPDLTLILAKTELNTQDIVYLKLVLGLNDKNPNDINIAGILTVKEIKTENITTKTIETGGVIIDNTKGADVVGSAVIAAGEKEIIIETAAIGKDSGRLMVTPISDKPLAWSVAEDKDKSNFTIKLAEPNDKDVSFNWWIIEEK